MPLRGTKSEYRGQSCHRCHRQKIRCTRERPCRNCALANKTCTYAVRDRKITVSENYLRRLEGGVINQRPLEGSSVEPTSEISPRTEPMAAQNAAIPRVRRAHDPLVEDLTAERFVSKLKQSRNSSTSPGTIGTLLNEAETPDNGSVAKSMQPLTYEYFALNHDTSHEKCSFKLPPYPYVVQLFDHFTIYLGHDWHWFRRQTFRRRLHNTYMIPNSNESKDRVWLCQLLVVLALCESVNYSPQVELELGEERQSTLQHDGNAATQSPLSGTEYFEQALRLLNIPYETASLEHVEVLNLMALYSHSLNRQKTAYMYSGASSRMCNMLRLHKASELLKYNPVEREHRKRVWWSTFCLDRMTSNQLGTLPSLQLDQVDLDYPTQSGLSFEDLEEFADADYLTARVQLTTIEASNADSMRDFGYDDAKDIENILKPMLHRLNSWKAGLSAHINLDVERGMPKPMRQTPSTRSLANFHLRFNQSVILLLRPLLLKQVACIFANEDINAPSRDLEELNNICLRAARSNVRLLIDLRTYGFLARIGFMENMHLFSSLMILYLSSSINARRSGTFDKNPDDDRTYEAGKEVLIYMMHSGSWAAKGHLNMLGEVEELGLTMAMDGDSVVDVNGEQWDADEWMTQLFESENMSNYFLT